jgi:hypothetical protein
MVSGYGSLKQELQKIESQKSDNEEKNMNLFQDYIIPGFKKMTPFVYA